MCNSEVNIEFFVNENHSMHDIDTNKRTPLMHAIEARKPFKVINAIMETLSKSEKEAKDDRKLMAIHYFCKFGVD